MVNLFIFLQMRYLNLKHSLIHSFPNKQKETATNMLLLLIYVVEYIQR